MTRYGSRTNRERPLEVIRGDSVQALAPDLAYKRLGIVNIVFYGQPGLGDAPWVLIDAGLYGTAHSIIEAAEARFGSAPPEAIILTHGHFDHVGALTKLAEHWHVPIYAHPLERPYLDGRAAYPPPDPSVGGGLMARLSGFYPRGPIDVSRFLRPLPRDGHVPGMPGWRWLHTPGHSPGHVSLWRNADRLLIAGDAFVTTRQESAYAAATQKPELHGPPMYFTPDWRSAEASVKKLAALEPETVVAGHGPALRGPGMRGALHHLADEFAELAIPAHGRYVGAPALAGRREAALVPKRDSGIRGTRTAAGSLLVLAAGWLVYRSVRRRSEGQNPVARTLARETPNTQLPDTEVKADAPEVERTLTVRRSASDLYRMWLEPQTLAQVMGHFADIRPTGEGHLEWRVRLLGRTLLWETHWAEQSPDDLLRWEALTSVLPNTGSVRFRPAPKGWGTEVTLRLQFEPPGGPVGENAVKLFRALPENLLVKALRRFKSLAETGEIPTLERNPSARGRGDRV